MVLKLRVRICHESRCIETVGVARSGFAGRDPEITIPEVVARKLLGERLQAEPKKVMMDGTCMTLPRLNKPLDLYVVAEDRVEGPVKVYAYMVKGNLILLNDKTLSTLNIVIIDPYEGVWCFKDELGKKQRKGVT